MFTRLVIALLAMCCLFPLRINAHELLPQNVLQFIEKNPEASVEELQIFISENAPSLVKSTQSKSDIDLLLGNQETTFWDNSFDFFKLGIEHILSGPDHILFVISLLLAVISLKEILQLTGTFTIAHSITLILAGAGILTLPSRIVEPIVAFSISYVALEIGKYFGKDVNIVPGKPAEGGTKRRCPDITKLRKLGYHPKVPFAKGLAITAKWYDENSDKIKKLKE